VMYLPSTLVLTVPLLSALMISWSRVCTRFPRGRKVRFTGVPLVDPSTSFAASPYCIEKK
jgi:hypothetical protein